MHSNTVFLALIVIVVAASLWFSGTAVYKIYHYARLDSQTTAKTVEWTVETVSDEKFLVEAHYSYLLNGTTYRGDTIFTQLPYRNQWAAEEAIKENRVKSWIVWYDSKDFSYSSLHKHYPLKEMIYAGMLWALVAYFIWLGYYVVKKQS